MQTISMKIAVLGASGRSGRPFVAAALAAGHAVRAGVRRKAGFTAHRLLEVVTCDATNPEDLRALCQGQDAVVSLIGHVKGSSADVQTVAMHALIPAMREAGVSRLISLTGTGVRFPGDAIDPVDWAMNVAVGIIDPARVKDGIDHVKLIQKSGLDWTVLRVLKLTGGKPGSFKLTPHGPAKWFVGRGEVAQALVEILESEEYLKQAPVLSAA